MHDAAPRTSPRDGNRCLANRIGGEEIGCRAGFERLDLEIVLESKAIRLSIWRCGDSLFGLRCLVH